MFSLNVITVKLENYKYCKFSHLKIEKIWTKMAMESEECKREKLEEHRKEAKEYHSEVVSIFMADKVDQQASKIQELEVVVKEFIFFMNYLKLNGIIWTVTNRDKIVNKIHQIRGEPQTAMGAVHDVIVHAGDANYSSWNGTTAEGPKFVIHSFYYLHPTLTIENELA